MVRLGTLFWLGLACVGTVTGCLPGVDTKDLQECEPTDETVDCCTTSEQCETHFGSQFPHCSTPGDETGRCVECTTDSHCSVDSYCELTAPQGPFCAPLADD